jgi:hypothetical protein
MKVNEAISDLYRVIGWLEGMTTLPGNMIHGAAKAVLVDCVDKLELVGARLLEKDVDGDDETEEAVTRSDT